MTKTRTDPWDASDYLATDEDVSAYLEAAFDDGDPHLIAAALGDIARSKGMTKIAAEAGMGRESLYKALSVDGNPGFATGAQGAAGSRFSAASFRGMKGLTTVKRGASWPAPAAFGRLCGEAVVSALRSRANKAPTKATAACSPTAPPTPSAPNVTATYSSTMNWTGESPWREAARLQSFPDSFIFKSKLRETERQVGNAVPPILAWHVAVAVQAGLGND